MSKWNIEILCRLCTLAECIRRESRVRVARDETGRVRLSTLLPRALNFGVRHEATQDPLTRASQTPLTRASQTAKKARS